MNRTNTLRTPVLLAIRVPTATASRNTRTRRTKPNPLVGFGRVEPGGPSRNPNGQRRNAI